MTRLSPVEKVVVVVDDVVVVDTTMEVVVDMKRLWLKDVRVGNKEVKGLVEPPPWRWSWIPQWRWLWILMFLWMVPSFLFPESLNYLILKTLLML